MALIKEMTDTEIKQGVELFAQALRERPELFEIEYANPIEQYAYTSSSSYPGVFFPNSAISFTGHPDHTVKAIVLCRNGKFFLRLERGENANKSLYPGDYLDVALWEDVIQSPAEKTALYEFEKKLREAENLRDGLLAIKRVHKKDGKPFTNLASNFTNCKIGYQRWGEKIDELKVTLEDEKFFHGIITLRLCKDEQRLYANNINPDYVWGLIQEELKRNQALCDNYNSAIKDSHKIFYNAEKAVAKIKEIAESIDRGGFAPQIDWMIRMAVRGY